MGLHSERVLGLREDLEKFIIRQKKETCKSQSLRFEIIGKALLDTLKELVSFDELRQKLPARAHLENVRIATCLI